MATTAGITKDVIDLMEKKLTLLTGELDASQRKVAGLEQTVTRLEIENSQLRSQLRNPQADGLDEIASKMLVMIANSTDRITKRDVIGELRLPQAKGDYHFVQLIKLKFIQSFSGQIGVGAFYDATPAGREYLAQAGLL